MSVSTIVITVARPISTVVVTATRSGMPSTLVVNRGPAGADGTDADVTNANVNAAIEQDAEATRSSLGLGSAATSDTGDFDAAGSADAARAASVTLLNSAADISNGGRHAFLGADAFSPIILQSADINIDTRIVNLSAADLVLKDASNTNTLTIPSGHYVDFYMSDAGGGVFAFEVYKNELIGAPGPPGPPGADGAPGEFVLLTLPAYLALSPEAQMDGRWYVIPTT